MRYFTFEYWCSYQPGSKSKPKDKPGPRYQAYLESIRDRLPSTLRSFEEKHLLHDALLHHFTFNSQDGILTIQFILASGATLMITYGGVRAFNSVTSQVSLSGSHGYGDLGYDELELHGPGDFEHRMLFSSGIELHVRFERFNFMTHD